LIPKPDKKVEDPMQSLPIAASPFLRPCKRAYLSLLTGLAEVAASFWRVFRRLSFLALLLVRPGSRPELSGSTVGRGPGCRVA
jgi:hypothetical protein